MIRISNRSNLLLLSSSSSSSAFRRKEIYFLEINQHVRHVNSVNKKQKRGTIADKDTPSNSWSRIDDLKKNVSDKGDVNKTKLQDKMVDKREKMRVVIEERKHQLEQRFELTKHKLGQTLEDKKQQAGQRLEVEKHKLEQTLENKKVEMRLKLEEKRHELEERKQEIRDRGEKAQAQAFESVFDRFFGYMKEYGNILKGAFPDTLVKTYRVFSNGSSGLLRDMRTYRRVDKCLKTSSANSVLLSRTELEVYSRLPVELVRVAPVLLISAFPFAQNVVFPLALMFPRKLLSSHFWNDEQLYDRLKDDAHHREKALNLSQRELNKMLSQQQEETSIRVVQSIIQEKSGVNHVDILDLKILFGSVLSLHNLSRGHAKTLASAHALPLRWLLPRRRLSNYGQLLLMIDRAMEREGISDLDAGVLRQLAADRGFTYLGASQERMVGYLSGWLKLSKQLSEDDTSLLLHLPCLLNMQK